MIEVFDTLVQNTTKQGMSAVDRLVTAAAADIYRRRKDPPFPP